MAQVEQAHAARAAEGISLEKRLLADGLLTAYQVERLTAGQAEGLVLGNYRIQDRLGSGGMGQVYRAEHTLLGRRVALKVLARHLEFDGDAIRRFYWEVRVAAELQHPNIVTVHDAGECEGIHFLVMEYVDGVDLARLVRDQGPLPVPLACECIRQAAMGLQHACNAGFVHCDIKPANLLLARNLGQWTEPDAIAASPYFTPHSTYRMVKIVDLGLARRLGVADARVTPVAEETLGEGLAGSADYLAPEQACQPHQADIRSDLYGLGCTFYYLLTGQAPFPGGSWPDKLLRHQLDQPTPIRQLRPEVAPEVEAIVQRLMCKNPADRYALPADVAVVVHEWLAKQRMTATPRTAVPPTAAEFSVATTPMLQGPGTSSCSSAGRREQPLGSSEGALVSARSTGIRWAVLTGVAALLGLAVAGAFRETSWNAPLPPALPVAVPVSTHYLTVSGRPAQTFAHLAAAIEAARDGETIYLHGQGPFLTPPQIIRGKALHLKAAQAARARIQWQGAVSAWQALLTADRALTLDGVELLGPATAAQGSGHGPPHLLYVEGAAARLTNCRLAASAESGLLVVRRGSEIILDHCELHGRGSALVAELGSDPVAIQIGHSKLQTTAAGRAALTIWAREAAQADRVRLELLHTTIQAGRMAAFAGLPRTVEVAAQANHLIFRDALLSFTDGPAWRDAVRWQGRANRYQAGTDWLRVEGQPFEVRGLEQWRALWRDAEPDSSEENGQIVRQP